MEPDDKDLKELDFMGIIKLTVRKDSILLINGADVIRKTGKKLQK